MNGPLLTTSWDDGTPEDLEMGELLARHGYLGTFYATTGPGGSRTLDDGGMARLVELGHELGNHGRTHRLFVELSTAELLDETTWAENEIRRFGPPGPVVAPPRGAVDRRVIRILTERGLTVRLAPDPGRPSPRAREPWLPPRRCIPTAQAGPSCISLAGARSPRFGFCGRGLARVRSVIACSQSPIRKGTRP